MSILKSELSARVTMMELARTLASYLHTTSYCGRRPTWNGTMTVWPYTPWGRSAGEAMAGACILARPLRTTARMGRNLMACEEP